MFVIQILTVLPVLAYNISYQCKDKAASLAVLIIEAVGEEGASADDFLLPDDVLSMICIRWQKLDTCNISNNYLFKLKS